jgi:putative ATPase
VAEDFFADERETENGNVDEGPRPLADRMRPRRLEEFVGQSQLLGENALLRRLIREDRIPSMVFWGPPGCGKTALAAIIANTTRSAFVTVSAVTAGLRDVKAIMEHAKHTRRRQGRSTILFVDEIHRFNKIQQDAFLPFVENGTITLIGATTENPSFSIIAPLLSRCKVFVLHALTDEQLRKIVERALSDKEHGLGERNIEIPEMVRGHVIRLADGDARRALNLLEMVVQSVTPDDTGKIVITIEAVEQITQRTNLLYDRAGEEHYNLISALHKSLRSSDPQGALYWLARMLAAGEEPLYCARRMIRFAAEDIGTADPRALEVAVAAWEAYNKLGSPEGELALAEAAVYLATAPKSNAIYRAWQKVEETIEKHGSLPVPLHLRNAPTPLMKALDYGKDYQYDHDAPDRFSGQTCLPEQLEGTEFFEPGPFGFEKDIRRRLEWWAKKRAERQNQKGESQDESP